MTDDSNAPLNPETTIAEPVPPKKKRVRGPAIRRLRKASAHTISENSEEIAKALLDHTLDGNVNCAKLLFSLLDKTPAESQKRHKHRPTLASQLEAEPQSDPSKHPDGPIVISRLLVMADED